MNSPAQAYRLLLGVALLTLLPLGIFAESAPVHIDASLSTNTALVGDRVTLTVTASHAADQRIAIEPIQHEPYIMVWDVQSATKDLAAGEKSTTHTITLSSFVVGQHRVATNHVIVLNGDGSEQRVPLPELLLNVVSVLSNPPPALAEIKPAVKLPNHSWLRIAGMVLLIIATAVFAALLLRAWMKRPKAVAAVRALPPHEIALSALQALLSRGYIEGRESQPFYVELSAIVRVYLEDRFDLRAPEQTTEEFIRSSGQSAALSLAHRTLTQAFLEQSDLVKFARFEPSSDDMRAAWEAAAKLVRETIPAPVAGEGAAS